MNATPTTNPHRPRKMPVPSIVKAIREKHGSVREFSRQHNRPFKSVLHVIQGKETSSPIARLIADVVGREPHEIWPKQYAEDGLPLSTLYRRAS